MLKEVFKPEVLELIELRNWTALRDVLGDWPAPEVADLLEHLRKPDRVLLFRALSRDLAADVFAYLDLDQQNALLTDLTDEEARQILADLPPDDRALLLDELPGQVTQRVLNLLSPYDLGEARVLLGYPEDSVGRLMTPDYVAVRREWTVEQTLRHIRAHGKDRETINRLYVIDDRWRLLDDIELRKVILADPATTIEELMDHSFASVSAFADREEAVRMIRRYDIVALPVLASGDVLVGIVTVDDLLDVAEQEATEDFHRVGSVEPIRRSFREAGMGYLYRRRIGWLLALVVVNILSGAGIAHFEETISATLALIFFLPLLIASAGNAGAQASTLTV
jgi:magnesium transporter